ncbi:Ran-binding protein (RanBP10), putative [Rhizophagus clarus]|uniref:Ran-binding protein (RanBP10), putative n=1 Tax=Rhizophagus clarus TaxID=94130 RepID=A0A8H3M7K7_9GLOM|nr:Ran-binding protein (RanBP10), putative [Rhizophagus clarus]
MFNEISAVTKSRNLDTLSISPLPVKYWFYYYEITILPNPNNDKTIIAIGLVLKNYSIDRLPGCDTHSVGFHSDEGRTFLMQRIVEEEYIGIRNVEADEIIDFM